ncbi:MAG TPA: HAD domain-containing protein [Pseudomonadales bacterium]|nr:HAD domain-containing protein [Pseudomonadales bacterium]
MNIPNNIAPEFIIFLDFDGVLHPADANKHEKFRPDAIQSVNRILDQLDASIVLSTAWRMDYSTDKFNAWFNNRIIDTTPVHDLDLKKENPRFHEVINFLKAHGWLHIPWIAIDDKRIHYPKGSPAYITDHKIGLTKKDADTIVLIGKCMKFARRSLCDYE